MRRFRDLVHKLTPAAVARVQRRVVHACDEIDLQGHARQHNVVAMRLIVATPGCVTTVDVEIARADWPMSPELFALEYLTPIFGRLDG